MTTLTAITIGPRFSSETWNQRDTGTLPELRPLSSILASRLLHALTAVNGTTRKVFGAASNPSAIVSTRDALGAGRAPATMAVLDPGCVKTPIGCSRTGIVFFWTRQPAAFAANPGFAIRNLGEVVLRVPDAPEFSHGQDPKRNSVKERDCAAKWGTLFAVSVERFNCLHWHSACRFPRPSQRQAPAAMRSIRGILAHPSRSSAPTAICEPISNMAWST